MAPTFDSRRLRHQRQMDLRLAQEHRQLGQRIAVLLLRTAVRSAARQPIIAPSRTVLDALKTAIWEQVIKPYYIGPGNDALDGPTPRSPYALLLVQGITQATRIQAERQAALVRRLVKDDLVAQWLTGPRPIGVREMAPTTAGRITELTLTPTRDTLGSLRGVDGRIDQVRARAALVRPRGTYEPFHRWVDPNGYRLSDRIWRVGIDVRSRIDALLDYHIANGTSAIEIASLLEQFLTPRGGQARTVRPYPPPYGTEGSYAARRLARTEIAAAAHRATAQASQANPFVSGVQWRLSASHPKIDICDQYARGGPNGDGIYAPDQVPGIPHPHCLCSTLPVVTGSTTDLVAQLRADIQAARQALVAGVSGGNAARTRALQGLFNPATLTRAILDGTLEDMILAAGMEVA